MKKVVALGAILAALSGSAFAQAAKPGAPKPAAVKPAAAKPEPKPVAPPTPLMQAIFDARKVSGFAKDEFAGPVTTGIGQPFSVTLIPRSGNVLGAPTSAGYWIYENGVLAYSLIGGGGKTRFTDEGEASDTLLFAADMTKGTPYAARNGYGASTTVSVEIWRNAALAITSAPARDHSLLNKRSNERYGAMFQSAPDDFPLFVTVAGDEARRLTQDIRVIVEGTIAPLRSSKSTSTCKTTLYEPTIKTPREYRGETCYVGADITRIAYIDSATGKVLREFTISRPQ